MQLVGLGHKVCRVNCLTLSDRLQWNVYIIIMCKSTLIYIFKPLLGSQLVVTCMCHLSVLPRLGGCEYLGMKYYGLQSEYLFSLFWNSVAFFPTHIEAAQRLTQKYKVRNTKRRSWSLCGQPLKWQGCNTRKWSSSRLCILYFFLIYYFSCKLPFCVGCSF